MNENTISYLSLSWAIYSFYRTLNASCWKCTVVRTTRFSVRLSARKKKSICILLANYARSFRARCSCLRGYTKSSQAKSVLCGRAQLSDGFAERQRKVLLKRPSRKRHSWEEHMYRNNITKSPNVEPEFMRKTTSAAMNDYFATNCSMKNSFRGP